MSTEIEQYREQVEILAQVRATATDLLADVIELQDKSESGTRLAHADWLLLNKRIRDLQKVSQI
jgi:hypothetical protein